MVTFLYKLSQWGRQVWLHLSIASAVSIGHDIIYLFLFGAFISELLSKDRKQTL